MPNELTGPLAEFIRHLASEKRHSPRTCDSYQRDLLRLADWLGRSGFVAWQRVTNHDLRRYVATLSREGLSGRSIARHLSATRRFYQFLLREKLASDNPALDIRAPKSGRRLPRVADVDQLNHLLDGQPDDPLEVRDLCMFELMYSSGLRLAELASLDLDTVDLRSGEVRVMGKGDKERLLPVGRKAISAIQAWLPYRAALANDGEAALFVSQRGERLSHRSIQARLSRWGISTCCDTRLPATCLNPVVTFVPYRNFWAMPTLPRPRSILILIFNIWRGFMTRVTPEHDAIGIMVRPVTRVPEASKGHPGVFHTSTVQQG